MMMDLLSHSALFDGLEKWTQVAENVEQLKVLYCHDWLRIQENSERQRAKFIKERKHHEGGTNG